MQKKIQIAKKGQINTKEEADLVNTLNSNNILNNNKNEELYENIIQNNTTKTGKLINFNNYFLKLNFRKKKKKN